jgi:hypothetical protein
MEIILQFKEAIALMLGLNKFAILVKILRQVI